MRKMMLACILSVLLAGCAPVTATQPGIVPSEPAGLVPQVSTSLPGGATPEPTEGLARPADAVLALETGQARLKAGEIAALRLDEGYQWTLTVADEHVFVQLDYEQDGWRRFAALAAGTTTLRVQGDPLCLTARPPCMAPSRLVEIEIIVE